MKPEIPRAAMSVQERDLRARIAQAANGAGILHGTLSERNQLCGKPNCRCTRGERHRTLILTIRSGRKAEQIYIPRHLEATVRRWVKQDHDLRDLLLKLGQLHANKIRKLKTRSARSSDAS